jgi:hypothetical protein
MTKDAFIEELCTSSIFVYEAVKKNLNYIANPKEHARDGVFVHMILSLPSSPIQ